MRQYYDMWQYHICGRIKNAAYSCQNAKTERPARKRHGNGRGHPRRSRERRTRSGTTRKQRAERWTSSRGNSKMGPKPGLALHIICVYLLLYNSMYIYLCTYSHTPYIPGTAAVDDTNLCGNVRSFRVIVLIPERKSRISRTIPAHP